MHESVAHVLTEPSDELKSLLKKESGERGRHIAAISKQLAPQALD